MNYDHWYLFISNTIVNLGTAVAQNIYYNTQSQNLIYLEFFMSSKYRKEFQKLKA